MMRRYDNMATALYALCSLIEHTGRETSPRGLLTRELPHATFELTNPLDTLHVGTGRGMNTRLAAVEVLELVGGVSDPTLKTAVAPNTAQFMNDRVFRGAYGPRVVRALPRVVRTLLRDPDSRQAALTIFHSETDLFMPEDTRDVPCTFTLHFLLRDGKLECHAYMRSNDVWWGLTYDAFVFTQLQLTLAHVLGAGLGSYYHTATSLHMYERDFGKWHDLKLKSPELAPNGLDGDVGIRTAMYTARALLRGELVERPYTASEEWYLTRVRG